MIGLYIHIPFCVRACPYCDFAIQVGAKDDFVHRYVAALRRELENSLSSCPATINTIFFGGGTPTLLESTQLTGLMDCIRAHSVLAPDVEVSIEANPENLDEEKLAALRTAGWNRLSLGAQSFDEEALRRLGRRHAPKHIEAAFAAARRAGFDNISLDLIYAVPGQSRRSWRETLRAAAALQPEHVSCYSLTIEEGTAFARRVERGRLAPVADEEQADLMQDAETILNESGILRYEVSNYARPGRECRHNLNYWRGGDYLACGCGAHGHHQGHRWWNERSAAAYVAAMENRGAARVGEERLSPFEKLNERVLLGLRLRDGVDLKSAARNTGLDAWQVLGREARVLVEQGVLRREGDTLALEPSWVPLTDAVAARLLRACD